MRTLDASPHQTSFANARKSSIASVTTCNSVRQTDRAQGSETRTGVSVTRIVQSTGDVREVFSRDQASWVNLDPKQPLTSSAKLTERVKATLLPEGFPNTVTPDYLDYQLWAVPTHITGWLATSLVTSTLLTAVGIGTSPAGAAATGAAIKWITKDGVGALGRFLVGGSLGRYFDEDPRFWRMVANTIFFGGAALEIITARTPSAFVVLATTGNLAKAVAKGIARPSFRVVQNHFAAGNNVGDVAAKEEIWEVCGQLTGLLLSVGILNALSQVPDPSGVHITTAWIVAQAANYGLRLKALSVLQLPWLSQKRVSHLATLFVSGEELPTVQELCTSESFLLPKQLLRPAVFMNASVPQLAQAARELQIGSSGAAVHCEEGGAVRNGALPPHSSPSSSQEEDGCSSRESGDNGASRPTASGPETSGMNVTRADQSHEADGGQQRQHSHASVRPTDMEDLSALLALYASEAYVLVPAAKDFYELPWPWRQATVPGDRLLVGVKQGATPRDQLQAMLQAAWLVAQLDGLGPASRTRTQSEICGAMAESVVYARTNVDAFVLALRSKGWNVNDVRMRSNQSYVLLVEGEESRG